jgi:hypothetical protein
MAFRKTTGRQSHPSRVCRRPFELFLQEFSNGSQKVVTTSCVFTPEKERRGGREDRKEVAHCL